MWVGQGDRNILKRPADSALAGNKHPSMAGQSGSFPSGLGGEEMRPGFTQDWGPGALGLALP